MSYDKHAYLHNPIYIYIYMYISSTDLEGDNIPLSLSRSEIIDYTFTSLHEGLSF